MHRKILPSITVSLLVLVSGGLGFQFGQPTNDDLDRRITALEQENRVLNDQVQSLTEYAMKNDDQLDGFVYDTQHLWVSIWIPRTEYHQDDPFAPCSGWSGWEMDNFGMAHSADQSLPKPTYGVFVGIQHQTYEGVEYCVQNYFFPAVVKTTPVLFGEWDTRSFPLGPLGYYWEVRMTNAHWEAGSVSLIVEP